MRKFIFLVFSLFVLPVLFSCTSFLYFPNSRKYVNEKKLNPSPKEIYFNSSQGELTSWYFEAMGDENKPVTVVFAHGNGQNMSTHFKSLHWLPQKGINFLIVEYPGYGPNGGSPSPASTIEATILGIDWVRQNRPEDQIFLFGQSLGGNVMLRALSEYANKNDICAVAIESSFGSYQKVAQETLTKSWLLWALQWLPYLVIDDSRSIAKNFNNLPDIPYLIIHGTEDNTVPFYMGEELYSKLPPNKQFWKIDGGRHIDTFFRFPFYRERFVEFIESHCLKASSKPVN